MEHIQPSARLLLELKPMRNYGVKDKVEYWVAHHATH